MDAKELIEKVAPIPAKQGEDVPVMVRSVTIFYRERNEDELVDPATSKVLRPALKKGEYELVQVRLVAADGRRFQREARTPTKCRALLQRIGLGGAIV